jgi:tRNA(Ile)-lysidine synthase
MIFGVRVDRPLLKFTKQALLDYCEAHHISYGIDESNESDDYLRNKVRKQLAGSSIAGLLNEKEAKNQQLKTFRETHADLLRKSALSLEEFYALPYPLYFLGHWIRQQLTIKALSEDHLEELFRQIQSSRGFKQSLQSGRIIKQYGQISVLPEPKSYTYILKEAQSLRTPFFEIMTQAQDQHAFEVAEDDFPLTIRSAQANEVYFIGEDAHKLSRWFISHKIPQEDRETWPVVLNCHGEVIHIFRIKLPRRVNTHKTRLYMIK